MSHEIENTNKETETIKKNEIKVLEWKNTIIEIKKFSRGLNNRYKLAEERISRLEGGSIEIIQTERRKEN